MEDQLISYKTAVLAKEKGFKRNHNPNVTSYPFYNLDGGLIYKYRGLNNSNFTFVPSQSILQRWIREKHNIQTWVEPYVHPDNIKKSLFLGWLDFYDGIEEIPTKDDYKTTWEECMECLLFDTLTLLP